MRAFGRSPRAISARFGNSPMLLRESHMSGNSANSAKASPKKSKSSSMKIEIEENAPKEGKSTRSVSINSESRDETREIDMQYLRYARRLRNRNILFKALFLFTVEISMIIFIV